MDTNRFADRLDASPSATVRDIKQLAWSLLCFWLIIAGLAYWSRNFFGSRTALWMGVGLAVFVAVVLVLVAVAGALANAIDDRRNGTRRRSGRGDFGGADDSRS